MVAAKWIEMPDGSPAEERMRRVTAEAPPPAPPVQPPAPRPSQWRDFGSKLLLVLVPVMISAAGTLAWLSLIGNERLDQYRERLEKVETLQFEDGRVQVQVVTRMSALEKGQADLKADIKDQLRELKADLREDMRAVVRSALRQRGDNQ